MFLKVLTILRSACNCNKRALRIRSCRKKVECLNSEFKVVMGQFQMMTVFWVWVNEMGEGKPR